MSEQDLKALLERVEAASGADREIDCALAVEVGGFTIEGHDPWGRPLYGHRDADGRLSLPGQGYDMLVPRYTASLDAALGLVGRVLPRWELEITSEYRDDDAAVWRVNLGDPLRGMAGEAPTPALAMLAAMLTALLAQETSRG